MKNLIKMTILSIVMISVFTGCFAGKVPYMFETETMKGEVIPETYKIENISVQIKEVSPVELNFKYLTYYNGYMMPKEANQVIGLQAFNKYFKNVSLEDGADLVIESAVKSIDSAKYETKIYRPMTIFLDLQLTMHINVIYKGKVILDKDYMNTEVIEVYNQVINLGMAINTLCRIGGFHVLDIYQDQLMPDLLEALKGA